MEDAAIRLRHELHRHPELSGQERGTATRIVQFFAGLHPDNIIEGLGGNGVAVVFSGKEAGPTVLLRCELDALPVEETIEANYRSANTGVAHTCGHDGHMAILAVVGAKLAATRPPRGKVVLLYQPSEETGEGAAAVIQDPKFEAIRPHSAFALHNLPGFPLGQVIVRAGTFACASRGMAIRLVGTTAHAAQPETGRSPTNALCRIIQGLSTLPPGSVPAGETAFVTVVGASLGEKAFGIAPARAETWATLRSERDDTMSRIVGHAERLVRESAAASDLNVDIGYEEIFPATINSQFAVELIRRAIGTNSLDVLDNPFRWSEDFGRFTAFSEGALFGIGAGTDVPDLHRPDYDFPDALIPLAAQLFGRIADTCLAGENAGR
ncbi:MAG: amidohydrolase [Desulfobulbus sp.]